MNTRHLHNAQKQPCAPRKKHLSPAVRLAAVCLLCAAACLGIGLWRYFAYQALPDDDFVAVSDAMTFDEMMDYFVQEADRSYRGVHTEFTFDNETAAEEKTYRVLRSVVEVTARYKPTVDFYCSTRESADGWEIASLVGLQLNRTSATKSARCKAFGGEIQAWVRGENKIEYVIKGDFFNSGQTVVAYSFADSAFDAQNIGAAFDFSTASTPRPYASCYRHETQTFSS